MTEDNASLIGNDPEVIVADDAPSNNEEATEDATVVEKKESSIREFMKDEELLKDPSVDKFKTVDEIFKSYKNLEKKLGSRLEDLSADDIKVIDKKLGIPENVKGYDFEETENESVKKIRDLIAEAKISKNQGENLDKLLNKKLESDVKNEVYSSGIKVEESRKELEMEFGLGYKSRIELANQALHEVANEEEIKYFKDKGFANDPKFIKMLAKMGDIVGEDSLSFKKQVSNFGITPADVSTRIEKIVEGVKGNLDDLYNKSGNKELLKQYKSLIAMNAKYETLQRG